MTITEMQQMLRLAGVRDDEYIVGGGGQDGVWCILDHGGAWEVFTWDRGTKGKVQVFSNEDAACYYLLGRLVDRQLMRKRLIPAQDLR